MFDQKNSKYFFQKLGFQKLNKIFNSQVRFFGYRYIIIFQSTKMLGEIADLRLCALMSCLLFGAYLNIVGGPFELVGKKLN